MQALRAFVCGIYDKLVKNVVAIAPGHHVGARRVPFVYVAVTNYPEFHV